MGPAGRGYNNFNGNNRQNVNLSDPPSSSRGVVVEAPDADVVKLGDIAPIVRGVEQSGGGAPLETPTSGSPIQLKLTRESPDTLIVRGTPERVDAALKLLDQLGQK